MIFECLMLNPHRDGKLHNEIRCPNCGSDMTDLEYLREDYGKFFIWKSFRKCPKCGTPMTR